MSRTPSAAVPKASYAEVMRSIERLRQDSEIERSRNSENPPPDLTKSICGLVDRVLRRVGISDETRGPLFVRYLLEKAYLQHIPINPTDKTWDGVTFNGQGWSEKQLAEYIAAKKEEEENAAKANS